MRIYWKWFLPIVQLALALACHVCDPHLYRVIAERDGGGGNLEYFGQHFPALAKRVSQGLNFPALVLDYPIKNAEGVIFTHNSDYTFIRISITDVGFFLGTVLFWFWVGSKLDQIQGRIPRTTWSRKARIAGVACGVVFGILTGAYADQLLASKWLPERQIGACGIAWASVLIAHFTWRLTREFGTSRNAKPVLLVAFVTVFMVAVLWIGGPYGATQALGEYLRPTTVKMMSLPADCAANEIAPADLMRIVESQKNVHHLALQKVVVCRSVLRSAPGRLPLAGVVFDAETGKEWLPLKSGCCVYQFRRHFAVVVADISENGSVIVQAALIQSRWDYLRLNWNKIRTSWFWPYPRV